MPETLWDKLAGWNVRMGGIPRKGLLVAVTLFCAWLAITLFPYCWPFMIALVFSFILEPFVRLLTKGFRRLRIGRSVAALLGMAVLFGLVFVLMLVAINQLWQELMSLARAIPGVITWLTNTVIPWAQKLYMEYQDILPPYALVVLDNAIKSLGQTLANLATSLSRALTSTAWATAMSLMDVILSVVLTIMGTYYLTADRSRINAFFHRTFPVNVIRHSNLIKANLIRALFGQIKSQLTVSMIIISFLVLVFIVFGVPYGLLAGLVIGVADALPVIGAGLFLLPWSIVSFIIGDIRTGIIMASAYVGTVVTRQISEPRIVGKNLGLYPLATMIAMYAGYQAFGLLGLLGGPVVLNVIKAVLEADKAAGGPEGGNVDAPGGSDTKPEAGTAEGEIQLPGGKKRRFKLKG